MFTGYWHKHNKLGTCDMGEAIELPSTSPGWEVVGLQYRKSDCRTIVGHISNPYSSLQIKLP